MPIEGEGGPSVGVELAGLSAFVVREEGEPGLVGVLEEDEAKAGTPPRVGGGQSHRLRLVDAGGLGFGEPGLEEGHRLLRRTLEAHSPLVSGAARGTQCREINPKGGARR